MDMNLWIKIYFIFFCLIRKVVDDQGVLRYQGEVEQDVCQGQGKLYDQNGQLVYEGSFINNKFEGDLGTLYKDGEVLYQGGFERICTKG